VTEGTTEDRTTSEPDPDAPRDVAASGTEAEVAAAPKRRRGSIAVYAVAFGLMVAAAACVVVGAFGIVGNTPETSLFGPLRILRVASVLAGLSIAVAIAAVLVPRRSA
jgi:hypothetical protein